MTATNYTLDDVRKAWMLIREAVLHNDITPFQGSYLMATVKRYVQLPIEALHPNEIAAAEQLLRYARATKATQPALFD